VTFALSPLDSTHFSEHNGIKTAKSA